MEPRDAKALAQAIDLLTHDETTYRRYSEGAARRYRELFTQERMIDECMKLYTEL